MPLQKRSARQQKGLSTPKSSQEVPMYKKMREGKKAASGRTKLLCRHCHAIYDGKHWLPFEKLDAKMVDELKMSICPACHETMEHISDGVLHLSGKIVTLHQQEISNLLHNFAAGEEAKDILNRIERIDQQEDEMTVYTTKNQLAVKLGKKVDQAYKGGKLEIKWSKEDKPVEIWWHNDGKK